MQTTVRRGRAFCRDERGATLIEFGFLAIPFFMVIVAILETALIFLAGQILDSAVNDSARLVRTGQAQTLEWNGDNFRGAICEGLYGLFDCSNGANARLRVSVAVVTDFSTATVGYPLEIGDECGEDGCDWKISSDYVPGTGADVVLVRAFYKWPTIADFFGFNFATLAGGDRLLGASRVFRNEPFGCSDCS